MDNRFKYVGEALILAIGLFLAGGAISKGIVKFKEMDRTVTAKGLSEKEVKANKAIWPLKFKELGNDPSGIYDCIEKDTRIIVEFLKKNGITDEEISLAEAGGYAGTSDTEFICRLNARLPLRYIENGQCVR